MDALPQLQVLWDYLCLHRQAEQAEVIVGFGSFDDNIARRSAELYLTGYAPKILFTGGLGRCTEHLFSQPEAERFRDVAVSLGVRPEDILLETKSTNTKENILLTRALLEKTHTPHGSILGVHKPYMERRITAAMGVYWPEQVFSVTSPQMTIATYLQEAKRQGMTENAAVSVIVGDFQRIDLYAKKGYQLTQDIPGEAWEAYESLVNMGFDQQLTK